MGKEHKIVPTGNNIESVQERARRVLPAIIQEHSVLLESTVNSFLTMGLSQAEIDEIINQAKEE